MAKQFPLQRAMFSELKQKGPVMAPMGYVVGTAGNDAAFSPRHGKRLPCRPATLKLENDAKNAPQAILFAVFPA
jgi:hypothetical protein